MKKLSAVTTRVIEGKKKERPVKCVIFELTKNIQSTRDSIEDFFATGKEFIQAVPMPDHRCILIFYREKK